MPGNDFAKMDNPEDFICLVLLVGLGVFLLTGLYYVVIKPLVRFLIA